MSVKDSEITNIMLVEDHASFREAMTFVLDRDPELRVTKQAGSLAEAREQLEDVDIAVVDLVLPDGNGVDLIRDLRRVNSGVMVLVLSGSLDRKQFARAVEAGAAGVMDKMAGLQEITQAVKRLRAGESLLSQQEIAEMLRYFIEDREREREAQRAIAQLTAREREVLQALAEGLDSKQIARKLHIAVETEHTHMVNISRKLGVHSRTEAVLFAVRHGLVEIH